MFHSNPYVLTQFSIVISGVRAPGGDAESVEKRGLLWLLDEEAIFPGASDETFVERLMLQQQQQRRTSRTALSGSGSNADSNGPLVSKGPGEKLFVLHHFQVRVFAKNCRLVRAFSDVFSQLSPTRVGEILSFYQPRSG